MVRLNEKEPFPKRAFTTTRDARTAWLESIVSSLVDGVICYNEDGEIVDINPAAAALFGYKAEKDYQYISLEQRAQRLHTSDEYGQPFPRERLPVMRVLNGEILTGSTAQNVRLHTLDGRDLLINMTGGPLYNEHGKQLGVIAICRDITEQRRSDQQLQELHSAHERVKALLNLASHELRTPLTIILFSAELALLHIQDTLEKQELPIETILLLRQLLQQPLQQIVQQTDILSQMVTDLLDLSYLQSHQVKMQLALHSVTELVQTIVENQRTIYPYRTISLCLSEAQNISLYVDKDRITQVILHYLHNALSYSDGPIAVAFHHEDTQVRFSVRDEGPGLTKEEQENIWEYFYRTPTAQQRSRGLGLGLHLCRIIIKAHNGEVGVESRPGNGAIFWFTLPTPAAIPHLYIEHAPHAGA